MLDTNLPRVFAEKFPNIKLIMVCRNPVKRAFSHYLMDITNKRFDPAQVSFHDALLHPRTYSYYDLGLYDKHLQRYLAHIQRENICIITLDDIRQMPEATLGNVCDFLGVSRFDALPVKNSINTWESTRLHRSPLMTTLRKVAKLILPGKAQQKAGFYYMNFLNKFASRFLRQPPRPTISEADQTMLKELYYQENRKLERLIERDLSAWNA